MFQRFFGRQSPRAFHSLRSSRIAPPSQLTKLRLQELEARDVPALYSVHFTTPGVGMTGDTAATISGSLTINSTLATDANGGTLVEASSIQDALERSIVGTVSVQHAGETLNYSMGLGMTGVHAAAHKAFRVGATAIELEDMADSANGSDWDYNDHYWSTSVSLVPANVEPANLGPMEIAIASTGGAAEGSAVEGYFVIHRTNTQTAVTVNYSSPTGTATPGLDYTGLTGAGSVSLGVGVASVTISPGVRALDDTMAEPTETVVVALVPNAAYTILGTGAATVTITDNDSGGGTSPPPTSPPPTVPPTSPPPPTVPPTSPPPPTVPPTSPPTVPPTSPPTSPPPTSPPPPGGGPTNVWITAGAGTTETGPANGWLLVNRSSSLGALTVNFAVDTTGNMPFATLGLDYEIVGSGSSVTFAAGVSQVPIYIHPLIDTVVESIEIVKLALVAGSGYIVYTPKDAFIEIADVKMNFDLDVDGNGSLANAWDKAENYLPGYKGAVAMLTTTPGAATSFNTSVFAPQRMKLVLEGIGRNTLDIVSVVFQISKSTFIPGYASNRSAASIEGDNKKQDYSFSVNDDGDQSSTSNFIVVALDSVEEQANGGTYRGHMEANYTWVNFYCKDYGGAASLNAHITTKGKNGRIDITTVPLKVPKDVDGPIVDGVAAGDGLADKWELEMGKRWKAQYGIPANTAGWTTDAEILKQFKPDLDNEPKDPDNAGPLVAQAEEGDAHTMGEEYRGYILDGGGLNGNGGGGHPGGHIRLDPARKEILVEVDRAAVINNLPGPGNDTNAKLKTILNGTSGVFSNATRGAGIYMYWLMDQDALQINAADVDTFQKQCDKLATTRNLILKSDFHHILLYDVGNMALFNSIAAAYGALVVSETPGASHHGVVLATSETDARYPVVLFPKREEIFSAVLAHEITHLLIPDGQPLGAFGPGEHIKAPNTDESELMYETTSPANRELSTVKIFDVVQAVLKTKLSEGLDQ